MRLTWNDCVASSLRIFFKDSYKCRTLQLSRFIFGGAIPTLGIAISELPCQIRPFSFSFDSHILKVKIE